MDDKFNYTLQVAREICEPAKDLMDDDSYQKWVKDVEVRLDKFWDEVTS